MRSFRALYAAALALVILPSTPLAAQDTVNLQTKPEPEIEGVGDKPRDDDTVTDVSSSSIIVEGERSIEEDEIRDAVRDIAMRGRTNSRALPRFQDPICPLVTGLGEQLGAGIKSRIEANTRAIGHTVGGEGCKPNAIVILVDDPKALIERLRNGRRVQLDTQTLRRIEATLDSGYPAISWNSEVVRNRYGHEAQDAEVLAGLDERSAKTAGDLLFRNDNLAVSKTDISNSLDRTTAMVVFDARQLNNVHLDQLADYATMRMLGDIQPFAQLAADQPDTILNLFRMDALEAAPALTVFDLAYLRGLYAMDARDPGSRLESFVLAAYDDLLDAECAETDQPCEGGNR